MIFILLANAKFIVFLKIRYDNNVSRSNNKPWYLIHWWKLSVRIELSTKLFFKMVHFVTPEFTSQQQNEYINYKRMLQTGLKSGGTPLVQLLDPRALVTKLRMEHNQYQVQNRSWFIVLSITNLNLKFKH